MLSKSSSSILDLLPFRFISRSTPSWPYNANKGKISSEHNFISNCKSRHITKRITLHNQLKEREKQCSFPVYKCISICWIYKANNLYKYNIIWNWAWQVENHSYQLIVSIEWIQLGNRYRPLFAAWGVSNKTTVSCVALQRGSEGQ